jgi:hypothetical protein
VTRLAHEHDAPVVDHLIRRAVGLPEQPVLMYWFTGIRNFGDILSPVIVEHMSISADNAWRRAMAQEPRHRRRFSGWLHS